MVTVENLTKSYRKKTVVSAISFTVKKGEVFALLGSNGAGKSTTIKMILGLVKPDAGDIMVREGKVIGYSPETPFFPVFLTGMEVLEYYGSLQKMKKEVIMETAPRLLEQVGLEKDRTKIKHYSKGMLQRLALAQALLGEPDILILDEPCAGLDAMGRLEMLEIIRKLKEAGKTTIMNTHILSDIEKICDKGVIMKKGKILRDFRMIDFQKDGALEGVSLEELFLNTVAV